MSKLEEELADTKKAMGILIVMLVGQLGEKNVEYLLGTLDGQAREGRGEKGKEVV